MPRFATLKQASKQASKQARHNCALLASCDRETYTNEYYIRDG